VSPDKDVSETTESLLSLYRVPQEEQKEQRLHMFMGTRLGVATLLLGSALWIVRSQEVGFEAFTPRFLIGLILTIYATTLVFALWLIHTERKDHVAYGQIVWDLALTTALVYVTGGTGSGFTFLYGVTVLMAAMVVGPTPARATGGVALCLYVALGTGLSLGWLPPPPDQTTEAYTLTSTELYSAVLFNILGLLLVTMLASGLATRLRVAGGRLRRAEAGALQLARLNDDIVRSLSSGLLTTDQRGNIRTVNSIGARMLAVDEKEILGKPVGSVIPVAVPEDKRVFQAEGTATRPDGSGFPIGYSITPLINARGADVGKVVVFQDLSELSRLREKAKRSERLAILGRLSAGLAHEIRNPLNSISGSVELILDSPRIDEQERRLLRVVISETDRLNDLVTTMLQVGRPVSPQPAQVDLRDAAEEVVEMARRGPAKTANVEIDLQVPEQPLEAWLDIGQVKQVLWNLIKNALQASPHGTVVRVGVAPGNYGGTTLEVSDQGAGLESNQKGKLYDMFYSERTHGAGIGLALVRQIVDAHGGSIEVDSSPERGTVFRVYFPGRP
jgi:two-component system sensor histidine kinase PilS (NtrC family)